MSNVVEIVIKAVNQTGTTLSGITNAFTGMNQGLELARKGFQALSDIYKATIQDTVDYTTTVIDMGRVLGITTEDTSRLIQASDDLFISQEKLNTALLAASRQGIDVSIEGLKDLSSEYLDLGPGAERAQFLMKTFGRSGADMGKLMEIGAAGIDTMTSAIEDNMVVTEQGAANIIAYKQTIDQLQDSWTGVKLEIGNFVIPILNKTVDTLVENTEWNRFVRDEVDRLGITYKNFGYYTATGIKTTKEWWENHYKAAKFMDVAWGRFDKMSGSIDGVSDSADGATDSVDGLTESISILSGIDVGFGDKIAGALKALDFREAGGVDLQNFSSALIEGIDNGSIGTDMGRALLEQMQVGSIAIAVKTGEMSASAAKTAIMEVLGLTSSQATAELSEWLADVDGKRFSVIMEIHQETYGDPLLAAKEIALGQDLNGNGVIGRAGGGPVWGATPYVVGERGPELFVPGQSGQIIPNSQLGGNNVTFYGDAYFAVEKELTAQDIMKQMRVEA